MIVIVCREPARYRRSSAVAQAPVAALQRFDRPTPSNSRIFPTPPNHLWCLLRLPLSKPQAQKLRIRTHPTRGKTSLPFGKRTSSRIYPTTPRRTSSRVRQTSPKKIRVAALMIRDRLPGAPPPRFLGLREVGEGREGGQHPTSAGSRQIFRHDPLDLVWRKGSKSSQVGGLVPSRIARTVPPSSGGGNTMVSGRAPRCAQTKAPTLVSRPASSGPLEVPT